MCNKQITLTIPAGDFDALIAAANFFDRLADSARPVRKQIEDSKTKCLPVEEKPETIVREFNGGTVTVEKPPEPVQVTQPAPNPAFDEVPDVLPTEWGLEPQAPAAPETPVATVSASPPAPETAKTSDPAPATPTAVVDMAPARTLPGVVIPWDERIHSRGRTKTANGCWTTKRQCPDDVLKQVEAELAGPVATVTPTAPDVAVAPAPVAPVPAPPTASVAQSPAPVPGPAQTPAPAVTTPAPAAPQTMADDPTKFSFQDLMTTTNKLGYKDFQKIQELGSLLKAWSNGQYNTIPEIAQLPEVMHGFAQHVKAINGVTE